MSNIFHQEDDFEDEAYDERMAYGRGHRWMVNPNSNRGGGFLFPNHDRRREDSSPNEYKMIEIPFFSRNLDIKSLLDWISKVEKFFDMAYVLEEKHVKFVAYKLKRGAIAWWDQLQVTRRCQGQLPVMT